jgi:hypothetical protein
VRKPRKGRSHWMDGFKFGRDETERQIEKPVEVGVVESHSDRCGYDIGEVLKKVWGRI